MLDENLPTFYLKPSTEGVKHNSAIYLSQYGSEPQPAYFLRRPDPSLSASRNRYAVALYDSYNPEILFGEVLLVPKWTQPTISKEEIRLNGGVPPPPQPILPLAFTIQLYNPEQQVQVKQKPGSWGSAAYWEFEMPQQTFRQPSTSSLDRTQSDPAASETTPKITFKWKKDGKLSKDLVCSLSGKSTTVDGSKKKNKEPDITVALFKHLKEMTLYEPNLYRVEMEDPKGLEVVILLSAVVIREVFFGQTKEVFNITEPPRRNSNEAPSSGPQNSSPPAVIAGLYRPSSFQCPLSKQRLSVKPIAGDPNRPPSSDPSQSASGRHNQLQSTKPMTQPRPPLTDPRTQWEIDAETARLKKQVEHEEREHKRAEHAETKRIKKMLEAEEKEARRKQAEVDKETARLKKAYGLEQNAHQPRPQLPPRYDMPQRQSAPWVLSQFSRPSNVPQHYPLGFWPQAPPTNSPLSNSPYLQPPGWQGYASSTGFLGNESSMRPADRRRPKLNGKRSVFGIRSQSDDGLQTIKKKQSSMF
ncbi:MAG: hypothetical protein M1830_003180 [Pleopsidium flavum]|nr:MAG: hypothetical protein M1830_003180 [Pleopsidium flavum]